MTNRSGFLRDRGFFLWEIRRSYELLQNGDWIQSPVYETGEMRWTLELRQQGVQSARLRVRGRCADAENTNGALMVFAIVHPRKPVELFHATTVEFAKCSKATKKERDASNTTLPVDVVDDMLTISANTICPRAIVSDDVVDNVMTFCCNVFRSIYSEDILPAVTASARSKRICGVENLSLRLKSYLQRQDTCDAVLRAEDEEFSVHRVILSAQSPVLKSMFSDDMLEKAVGMPDIKANVLREMINYMYGDEAEDTSNEICMGLYSAAKKFCMPDLRQQSGKVLASQLDVASACEVALLAHLHEDQQLLAAAQSFITSNAGQVFVSKGWMDLTLVNPALASEIATLSETCQCKRQKTAISISRVDSHKH